MPRTGFLTKLVTFVPCLLSICPTGKKVLAGKRKDLVWWSDLDYLMWRKKSSYDVKIAESHQIPWHVTFYPADHSVRWEQRTKVEQWRFQSAVKTRRIFQQRIYDQGVSVHCCWWRTMIKTMIYCSEHRSAWSSLISKWQTLWLQESNFLCYYCKSGRWQ